MEFFCLLGGAFVAAQSILSKRLGNGETLGLVCDSVAAKSILRE
jgi:hypothetical protein